MSASAPPVEAPPDRQAHPASPPLRIALLIGEPGRAARVRSALALHPDLLVLTDPAGAADIVVMDAPGAGSGASVDAAGGCKLTPREHAALELLAAGASNKMIGRRLGISPATAKFHVAALLAKLGARGRADAVAIGMRRGLLML